jgi:integrase
MFNNHISNKPYLPQTGTTKKRSGDMEKINLEHISRLGFPITLTQGNTTETDLYTHGKLRQELSHSTITKHLRYLRFMQNHPCPVNTQKPTLENFIQHLDYRKEIENATPNALQHEYKAMKFLLRAYGKTPWDIKLPTPTKNNNRILPLPNTVHKYFNHKYSDDTYENKLYQYLYFHGFLIGWRTPSEPSILKTSDIILNDDGTGFLTITETKKGHRIRTIMPEKEILTDYRRKSLKNWMDHWRPKVTNQHSKDYFYLQPSGKPFTKTHLGHRLSEKGKQIFPYFSSYDMRHWCAIARLIQEKHENGTYDAYIVKHWLGHEEISSTMKYIQHAEQYYRQAPYNWIKRVLKNHHRKMVEDNSYNSINHIIHPSSNRIPSRKENGPAEAYLLQQERIYSINTLQKTLSESQSFFFPFFVGVAA